MTSQQLWPGKRPHDRQVHTRLLAHRLDNECGRGTVAVVEIVWGTSTSTSEAYESNEAHEQGTGHALALAALLAAQRILLPLRVQGGGRVHERAAAHRHTSPHG